MSYKRVNNESFVNPYNFARLPKGEKKREKASCAPGLTGKLHCIIITKTPLAIPDTYYEEDQENKHKTYSFNIIDGKKAISGSSIRGCIRSVYETLTDSCFVTMSENEYISNRVNPKGAYKPGLLVREGKDWKLYEADRLLVKIAKTPISQETMFHESVKKNSEGILERYIEYNGEDYHFGDFVTDVSKIDIGQPSRARSLVTDMRKSDSEDYCLYIGEPMEGRKKYQSLFKRKSEIAIDNKILCRAVDSLDFVAAMYKNRAINKNYAKGKHSGYAGYEHAKENGIIPIWYNWNENTKNLSLSLAAIGRKVYGRTVNELSNGREPCKDRNNVCPACALFGMAKGNGIGSKIRFSDAFITKEGSSEYVTLKELGTPRMGYYPFYSANGEEFDNSGAEISGRKFYWHIPEAGTNADIYKQSGKTERNSTIEILKDSEFEFDVYYDDISEKQLSELKFALTLGDKKDGSLCHKLGHGKPLGLGSVKITIESEMIRKFDESGYSVEKVIDVDTFCNSDRFLDNAKEDLLRISDLNAVKGENVRYPYVIGESTDANSTASHQWFTKNRECALTERQLLGKPTSKSHKLHPYEYISDNGEKARSKSKTKRDYEIGNEYVGTLLSWKNDKWAQIELDNGGRASVFDPEHKYSVNQKITVIYRGKQKNKDKLYDKWNVKK